MTWKEFCEKAAPIVLEIEDECRKMTEEEFEAMRKEVLSLPDETGKARRFMAETFNMIHRKLFEKITVA